MERGIGALKERIRLAELGEGVSESSGDESMKDR